MNIYLVFVYILSESLFVNIINNNIIKNKTIFIYNNTFYII